MAEHTEAGTPVSCGKAKKVGLGYGSLHTSKSLAQVRWAGEGPHTMVLFHEHHRPKCNLKHYGPTSHIQLPPRRVEILKICLKT